MNKETIKEEFKEHLIDIDFGIALRALKTGYKVERKGWNGKGMHLTFINSSNYKVVDVAPHSNPDGILEYELLPWIGMKTADDKFVPWLASQTDILAEDWKVIIN